MEPGGRVTIDVNSPEVIDMVFKVTKMINMQINSMYYYKHVKINKAESQVVQGAMYYLDISYMPTTCLKNEDTINLLADQIMETCAVATENGPPLRCTASVWFRPWLPEPDDREIITIQSLFN